MELHLVSGFLGSGKTTAIQTACTALRKQQVKAAVITNDQGSRLVDTGYITSHDIPARQVLNGCFCCNYNALDESIQSLSKEDQPEIIFAESVGSCTDIVATVMKPLLNAYKDVKVTVSTFADARLLQMLYLQHKQLFNEEIFYIYQKQLEEAQVIVVSRVDLVSGELLQEIHQLLQKRYPEKQILLINGTSEESIPQWLEVIRSQSTLSSPASLEIDYDTYGAGEAMLGWLDAAVSLQSQSKNAEAAAIHLAENIYQSVQDKELVIGHLKFLVNDGIKISYTTAAQPQEIASNNNSSEARLLINARIQTSPELLTGLIRQAIASIEVTDQCKITIDHWASFQPGYPSPTHRIAD